MATDMTKSLIELSVDGKTLDVERVRGTLAVSELFRFVAEIVPSAKAPTHLTDLVEKDFELSIASQLGEVLCLHGIVASCDVTQDDSACGHVLELRPKAYKRALRRNHRVFQDATVQTIVNSVLTGDDGGVGEVKWSLATSDPLPKRAYTAQYGETDWAFIERLLSDEGLHYYFAPGTGSTTLVIAGDSCSAPEVPDDARVSLRHDVATTQTKSDANAPNAVLIQPHFRRRMTTDQVRLRDYYPKKPTLKLDVTHQFESSWREHYDFPGRFDDPTAGERRARLLGEALRATQKEILGHTNSPRLVPGYQFKLLENDDAEGVAYFLTDLSVTARRGEGSGTTARRSKQSRMGLSLTLRAIPAATPYRPTAVGPRLAPGVQTAVNVGPKGDEIFSDDKGYVRTQFYWDREGKRNETASTFMRVGQFPLAGSMMLPRIGWDQIIGFHAGDVDAPVVLGHLYDSVAKVPYALPENKTRTAWQTATTPANGTANEIRFEDKAGSEEIFLNASYDMTYDVGKDSSVTVGVDQSTDIGVNQTVKVGSNQSLTVGGAQEVSIGATETLTVSGARMYSITGNDSETVGAVRSVTTTGGAALDVDGGRSLTAGALMMTAATMGVARQALGSASITVGGAWISAAGAGMESAAAGASKEMIGGAKIQAAGKSVALAAQGKSAQTVGGALINAAGKDVSDGSDANLDLKVGGALVMAGPKVLIEAKKKLVIKVGGTTLTITPSKIHLKSPSLASPGATISKTGSTVKHN
jgi:type VI secretion system secreted protein VgrG